MRLAAAAVGAPVGFFPSSHEGHVAGVSAGGDEPAGGRFLELALFIDSWTRHERNKPREEIVRNM